MDSKDKVQIEIANTLTVLDDKVECLLENQGDLFDKRFRNWKPQAKRLYCFVSSEDQERFRLKCLDDGFTLQEGLSNLVLSYLEGTLVINKNG